jgi:subtilisin family serine protease
VTLLRAVIGTLLAVALLVIPGLPASAQPAPSHVESAKTVTLITGDVVRLTRLADGRPATTVEPGGPASRRGYQLLTRDGDSYVIPNVATELVAAGRLDEALFNITDLVADGFDDASRASLPLLIIGSTEPRALAGATVARPLPSIGAVAVVRDKSRASTFWSSLTGPNVLSRGKVWLDRKVHATLADSVPKIGAPQAWAKGFDGAGVKVAVLDTGYDATHPDLAGRVAGAADFTGEGSTVDTHGHGTHVAATVASVDSARRGVAPGAELLVGRVLDGSGSGDLSWVIAGMEWAVAQGAKVVSLSLGAGPSDGTDPVSAAVNSLTRSSGALFVIAAGNSGPDPETVEAPGAATDALTVGAVSKSDTLAPFSSRGPRIGDGMVKPEITAPGVNIIAARAAGTSLGELVDAEYTSVSGTSMATPHVAGAAAILAQQHPNWHAAELKAALVGSAKPVDPTAPANATGAGRVDVASAVSTGVLSDTSSVAFGHLTSTSEPQTAKVNYRNISDRPATLDLTSAASAPGKLSAALAIEPRRLTIAPGASASANLTLAPGATRGGAYTGQLVATGPQGTVRIPVGFRLDGPTHTLTVSALDRLGRPAGSFSQAQLWNVDTGELRRAIIGEEPGTLEVPAGRYALIVYVFTVDEGGWEREVTVLGEPQLTVTGDRTFHFDARKASQVKVITPEDAEIRSATVAWQRMVGGQSVITGFNFNPRFTQRYSAAATAPVSLGTFGLTHHFELAEPNLTATVIGRDSYRLPNPRHVDGTPSLPGHKWLRLVDGRDGTPEDLAGSRGAAVLIRLYDHEQVPTQLANAAAAGARVVFFRSDQGGFFETSAFGATVPAYHLEKDVAQPLLDRLAAGVWTTLALAGTPESPYSYQLHLPEVGRIPAQLTYDTRRMRLATVESEFHDTGDGGLAIDTRNAITPTELAAYSTSRLIPKPLRRKDYLTTGSPGAEVTWRHDAVANLTNVSDRAAMSGQPRTYRPGERGREVWFGAIVRPGMPAVAWPATASDLAYGTPVNRANDVIRVAMPHYATGDFGEYGWLDFSSDRAVLSLRRDGKPIGATTLPFTQFTVPGGAATYQLSLDVARDLDDAPSWWTTSTATQTTWTFRSARPAGPEVLPLLQIGYDLDTNLHNEATGRTLTLRPGYQPGAGARGPLEVRAELSYDDGKTWRRLDGRRGHNGATTVELPRPPRGAGFASLRVSAWDRDGNRLDQTINRAWKVAQPGQ